nr:AT-rich interactive domain-containing protein 4B isoform X1 [Bactrocera oleae]XP_036220982.1 AT-rich interactive domain-containing protein 4B isoform X1 [Bactrocera oleae]XP_036220983.1 AT-rich interactive domain-containing protein 4B isoform X1 [Bactrocera oleae]XP_036220984.1 AT-rich interactive domain-containing protein 4B isoform X1 [Bactrocera oleae]
MQQVDTDPPSLPVGTEVSAKYKGAFCEAKVSKVVRNIKVKVAYKQGLGSGIVSDDLIKVAPGQLRVGATVEVRHPDRKDLVECTVTKIQDCSQYTVVFDDGDITTLRRTALCLKSGRHFNESETLDQLPLTHPEHFGNPVVGGRRGRRRGQLNDDSSDEEDESDAKEVVNEKEEHIGNVVCVEMETKKKDKEKWFPGLILAPTAQANVRIRVKDEYLVRSFKDGRYYTVPKKETTEFTREAAAKQDGQAVQAALQYLDSGALPPHWDRESLFGLNNSSSEGDGELESDSSDDEPREEKDRFVAQLYKYMDDRGTPLNKVPSIQNRDVDLYRLFRAVQKCGGYNRVTAKNQWKSIAVRLGFTSVTVSVTNLVKQAYKKFLQPYGEFHRKLGCSMLMTPRNSNRSKGRSLVRANSVASPKPIDNTKDSLNKPANNNITASSSSSSSSASSSQNIAASSVVATTTANIITVVTPSVTEESENTSESSLDNAKNKRKAVVGKVKGLVEKYEEKSRDDCDVPLSKMKMSAETPRCEDKDKAPSLKDVSAGPTLHIRDSSPPGTSAGSKKDKSQKKQTPQSDDKRNKRKKDDTIEKVDTGDFIVEVGDKLKVYYHEKKVTYEAKVIEISVQRGSPMYLVHYTGWNNRYDEWVPRERIAENITKGSKQKGRMANANSMEKQKDNPSKPPSVSSLNPTGPPNSMANILGNIPISTKLSVSSKRGRGRSDSLPPRSTTPSSVASNSSRTKSPATSGLKRRPIRSMVNTTRRTSANVSDVSLQSESDTDSDEPVRRPTRGSKEIEYKSGSLSGKLANKSINSDTDVDDEEDDTTLIIGTNINSTKGRNYDLNQIRSELRELKSPSPPYLGNDELVSKVTQPIKVESVIDVKDICSSKSKAIVESNTEVITIKQEVKQDQKDDTVKSSTDMSSETESFCDDDSQSSGKTTTLENMTKRFQQKIKAGKQQALEKLSCGNPTVERVPKVVEKIIQDSLAEKLQESLKTKPDVKKEEGLEANISDAALCKSDIDKKEDSKPKILQNELHQRSTSNIQPRFESTINSSKYSSLIIEKPVCFNKKIESGCSKKTDISRKFVTDSIESQSKKSIEPVGKEINKSEPSAACSPSSSSSSSSASASSSSHSLPDMSKLDISGGSSTSSIHLIPNKDVKLASVAPKATSPDIYEFKDPEPFEFELRKLQTTSTNISSFTTGVTSACNVSGITRKSTQKNITSQISVNEKQQPPPNPMTVLVNRKKKGSPMKEAVIDKSKLPKTDGKLNIISEGKINKIASIIPVVTKGTLDCQTNLLTLNPLSSNPSLCSNSTTQKTEVLNNTSFDTLRTSPNFNVNINALNEELAQTVQETTRALTDAFQKPKLSSLQEVAGTPPKLASPKQNDTENLMTSSKNQEENVSKLISPLPTTPIKTVIGSPFIETRKDLSNVFELSTSEGFTSLSESKDNKFEFENAKKMLSATSDAFDLEPAKYENRPTSIADKLLKAINQKKEEDKYRIDPKTEKGEDGGSSKDDVAIVKNTAELILGSDCASNEPLNINIDLAGSPMSFGSNLSLEKLPIITGSINKPIPLTSPEPKLGILESITVKNNDLTETIQKLECAIQRKTPVSGLSVTTTPNTFSEDSMDSTDSERRLVIEDVAEDACDILKSPNDSQPIGETKISILPHKTDVAVSKIVPDNILAHIRADPQIQQTTHASRPQCLSASVSFPTISAPIIVTSANRISTVLHVVADMTMEQKGPQFGNPEVQKKDKRKQEDSLSLGIENSADIETRSNENFSSRDTFSVKSFETAAPLRSASPLIDSSKQHTQRSTDVVPILVPDIPVSVVVASGAVPSVKAAAQAAAEAAAQSPTSKIQPITHLDHKTIVSKTLLPSNLIVSSEEALTIDKNSESKITFIQDTGVYIDASNDLKITPPSTVTCPSITGISANSGFYLDVRTELRPEDGVKPIHDIQHTNTEIERFNSKKVEGTLCADELASNFGVDTNNESINLLCEETIPGSPTPAFGGKEEPSGTQLATESTLLLDSNIKVLGVTEPGALLANMNNSPNDSASHDDSSEDVKKQVDIENEISPRKRRRPRKQSEMIITSDHHTKRRKQMTYMKKIPAGSDSDENSDGTSQRILESRHNFQQQFQLQQPQTSVGIRSCPYNFLVQLDPSLGSDQCIAILLKQIQELRKTYNAIKIDLASIDRRRKKLRRREREKKQQVQNQQVKIS